MKGLSLKTDKVSQSYNIFHSSCSLYFGKEPTERTTPTSVQWYILGKSGIMSILDNRQVLWLLYHDQDQTVPVSDWNDLPEQLCLPDCLHLPGEVHRSLHPPAGQAPLYSVQVNIQKIILCFGLFLCLKKKQKICNPLQKFRSLKIIKQNSDPLKFLRK